MGEIAIGSVEDWRAATAAARPGDALVLAAGEYRVKSELRVPGVSVVGAGVGRTRVVWDDAARDMGADGRELVTFRTYTLAVLAPGVRMRGLSIVNDAHCPERRGQEVALSVYADDFRMEDCEISSTQDSLFAGPLPADLIERYEGFLIDELRADIPCSMHFRHCLIEGTVDFIFGSGEAFFDECEIRSLPEVRGTGYVAAPSHAASDEGGFTFSRCAFTGAEGVPEGSVYLARPWRDYGLARFIDCTYGPHISPLGFDPWGDTSRDRTARFYESPAVPGRVPWVK